MTRCDWLTEVDTRTHSSISNITIPTSILCTICNIAIKIHLYPVSLYFDPRFLFFLFIARGSQWLSIHGMKVKREGGLCMKEWACEKKGHVFSFLLLFPPFLLLYLVLYPLIFHFMPVFIASFMAGFTPREQTLAPSMHVCTLASSLSLFFFLFCGPTHIISSERGQSVCLWVRTQASYTFYMWL